MKVGYFYNVQNGGQPPEICVLSKFNEKEGSIVVQREPVTIYSDGGETILKILSCAFPVCFWAFQPYIIVFV